MSDDAFLPIGRGPIRRRFGKRRSKERRLHCRNIDRGDSRGERIHDQGFLGSRILANTHNQRNQRQRYGKGANDFSKRNRRL